MLLYGSGLEVMMIHNLVKAANEIVFNRKISGLKSKNVQGAIDEVSRTIGYTVGSKKNFLNTTIATQTINGLTITTNENKSITLNGTPTADMSLLIGTATLDVNDYILSGTPKGASGYYMYSSVNGTNYTDNGNGVTIPITEKITANIRLVVFKGFTLNNVTLYPMIRPTDIEDDTYEPYVADVQTQLTTVQTINLRTGATLYVYGKIAILILDGVVINSENSLLISDEKYKPIQGLVRSWCRYDSNSGLKYHAQFGIYNNGHMTCTSIATDGSSTSLNNGKLYGQVMFNIK